MNNMFKNMVLRVCCLILFSLGLTQTLSIPKSAFCIENYNIVFLNDVKQEENKELTHKSWDEGSFEEIKKSVLEFLDSKIKLVEDEINKLKSQNDKEKVKILERKLEKIKEIRTMVENSKSKEEIKNAMQNGLRKKGKKNN